MAKNMLEIIKKKIGNFEKKSDAEAFLKTPLGDEFEYISSAKKVGEEVLKEEKVNEDRVAQFEDDLGIEDVLVSGYKAAEQAANPQVEVVEKNDTEVLESVDSNNFQNSAMEASKLDLSQVASGLETKENPKTEEKKDEVFDNFIAMQQAQAAEVAKQAMMAPAAILSSQAESTSPVVLDNLESESDPFAAAESEVFAAKQNVSKEDVDSSLLQERGQEDLAKQQEILAEKPAIPSQINSEENTAAAKQAEASQDSQEFDFSDLEEAESDSSKEPAIQKDSLDSAKNLQTDEEKNEITIDNFLAQEAPQIEEQAAEESLPAAASQDFVDEHDEFEKEMMAFVPQNSSVNNFQKIPQFEPRKQNSVSVESGFSISKKAAQETSESIQKLLDAKKYQSVMTAAVSQELNVDQALIERKLVEWLDKNLPGIVDRIVREEIQKLIK